MDQLSQSDRLSRITTMWSLLQQAQAGPADAVPEAQRLLMARYSGAVYRYLLGALHSEDAALELFQEFALRFVRGDFHRADPQRGRFRDYVKTVLIHLVHDYRKAQRAQPQPLTHDVPDLTPSNVDPPDTDDEFLRSWRDELLNRAWESLAAANATHHAVLLLHVENTQLTSQQIADQLSGQLGKQFSAGNVRVTLHRARGQFADLLVEEVRQSLDQPTPIELHDELHALQLLKLCESALDRRDPAT